MRTSESLPGRARKWSQDEDESSINTEDHSANQCTGHNESEEIDEVQGEADDEDDEEEDVGDEDEDDEGPGYAQFQDEEDFDENASENSEDGAENESDSDEELLKARRAMRSSQEDITTEKDTLRARREAAKEQLKALRGDKPPKQAAEEKRQKQLESREHKSEPTVMSSRRPVSRARTVVEPTHDSKRRDPRFDSLSAGPVNLDLLAKSYNFLPGLYEKEIKSLKATYDRLKRMEAHHAGPNAKSDQALRIREERQHVELALRRAESQRNERMRRETERNVKSRFKKENQRRVNAGLRPYFPKKVLRQKYEQLSSQQGKSGAPSGALKKAMERKVRKDAQKDRKSLGSVLGGGSRTDMSPSSRAGVGSRDGPPRKRGRRG